MNIKTIKTAKGLQSEIDNGGLHGLYFMPAKLYRGAPGVSQSELKAWIDCDETAFYDHEHGGKKSTDAMILGSRFDALLSDRLAFMKKHFIAPSFYWKEFKKVPPKRTMVTKAGERWKELKQENPGKTILSDEGFRQLANCKRSFMQDDETKKTITDIWQVSAFWEMQGALCKGMADNIHEDYIVDIKTTHNVTPEKFRWSARDFGYNEQAGWYMAGFSQFLPKLRDYYLAVVETGRPFRTRWFTLRHEDCERGLTRLLEHLGAYVEADFGKKKPKPKGKLILEIPERREHGMQEEF